MKKSLIKVVTIISLSCFIFESPIVYATNSSDIKDQINNNNQAIDNLQNEKMTEEVKEEILSRISGTTDMSLAADCDLVVEAAIENMKIKKEIFAELDTICKPETILASKSSVFTR